MQTENKLPLGVFAEVGDVGFKYRHLHLLLSAPPQSPP